ncbi:MAG: DinB family protein [Chloroflexi bacterium]|nr:DinB family protein [Chloroflexota bacterium]
MDRAKFLIQLDKEWNAFKEAIAGLSDADITRPMVGEWSSHDLIGHVATWDSECVESAKLMVKGRRGIKYTDTYNDEQVVAKRKLSTKALLKDLEDSHKKAESFIKTVPENFFARETAVRRLLRGETYRHYIEHGDSIREWRKKRKV